MAEAHETIEKIISEAWEIRKKLCIYGVWGPCVVFREKDPVRFDAVLRLLQQSQKSFEDLGLPFICHRHDLNEKIERTIDYWKQEGQA